MAGTAQRTLLCLTSYFKGNRFLQRARRAGARVFLLTLQHLRGAPWARDHLDDLFVMPSFANLREVSNGVAYLMRSQPIDTIVALDDYDVELAAALREHFRLGGLNQSTARFFRDKLAMRVRARQLDIPVPDFVGIIHHDDVRCFLAAVPPPWLMKPRAEASSIGIKKFHDADAVWRRIDELGDEQSLHLLERFLPGELYHVDALVHRSRVLFAEVGRYHRPLLEVWQGGGPFATRTAPRDAPEVPALRQLNERVLLGFGLERGAAHSEFIRAQEDGRLSFIETSARVGGACIADMVEAATGLNLWEEWAAVEVAGEGPYELPPLRQDYGGAVVSLARMERPDTSAFNDPEVFFRLDQKHHVGLVVRSAAPQRVEGLLDDYCRRIARDFQAVLPPAGRAPV
jgi:hypothetical protein